MNKQYILPFSQISKQDIALMGGLVTPDLYHVDVRSFEIIRKEISEKKLAIYSQTGGGTIQKDLQKPESTAQVLNNQQIIELAKLGEKIQAHIISLKILSGL